MSANPGDSSLQFRASLIAGGAALLGELVGGAASYIGTKEQVEVTEHQVDVQAASLERQLQAQAEQAADDFLRAERIAVYTKLLNEAVVSYQLTEDFLFQLRPETNPFDDRPPIASVDLRNQHDKLVIVLNNIRIVGAADVEDDALAVVDAYNEARTLATEAADLAGKDGFDEAEQKAFDALAASVDREFEYLDAVRASLDLEGTDR